MGLHYHLGGYIGIALKFLSKSGCFFVSSQPLVIYDGSHIQGPTMLPYKHSPDAIPNLNPKTLKPQNLESLKP